MLSFWINYVVAVQPRKWATEIGLALRYDLISVKPNRLAGRAQKKKQTDLPEIIDIEDVQIDYYDDPNLLQNRHLSG